MIFRFCLLHIILFFISACGGGGGGSLKGGCDGSCTDAGSFLSAVDVEGIVARAAVEAGAHSACLLYTSPSPRDRTRSRMPSSA